MDLSITTGFVCLLTVLLMVLSARVGTYRSKTKVTLGSGGNKTLERRIRAQGNLVEYAPFAMVLVFLGEVQGVNAIALIAASAIFFLARLLHGYALSFTDHAVMPRALGIIGTIISLVILVVLNGLQLIIV